MTNGIGAIKKQVTNGFDFMTTKETCWLDGNTALSICKVLICLFLILHMPFASESLGALVLSASIIVPKFCFPLPTFQFPEYRVSHPTV